MVNQIRIYKKDETISFRSTKGNYGGLSNMAPGFPLKIGHIHIRTSEALYQALKFPDFPIIQAAIISERSPMEAKKVSREYQNQVRTDWSHVRFLVMKFCIQLKLKQNWDLFSRVLLQTHHFNIVEFSEKGDVWGAADINDQYVGINAMGRLLMELRLKLDNPGFSVEIPNINNLMIEGYAITKNLL